jgi:toluene monooxygenase system ferredoxin subunit
VTFHRVAAVAELWNGDLMSVEVAGVKLVVIKLDDAVHAYANRCAHQGFELSRGTLDGNVLTCAAHHWQYDVTTGRGINPPHACLARFETKIEDGMVYVKL